MSSPFENPVVVGIIAVLVLGLVYLYKQYSSLKSQTDKAIANLQKANADLKKANADLVDATSNKNQLQQALQQELAQYKQQVSQQKHELSQYAEQYNQRKQEIASLTSRLAYATTEKQVAERKLEAALAQVKNATAIVSTVKEEVNELKAKDKHVLDQTLNEVVNSVVARHHANGGKHGKELSDFGKILIKSINVSDYHFNGLLATLQRNAVVTTEAYRRFCSDITSAPKDALANLIDSSIRETLNSSDANCWGDCQQIKSVVKAAQLTSTDINILLNIMRPVADRIQAIIHESCIKNTGPNHLSQLLRDALLQARKQFQLFKKTSAIHVLHGMEQVYDELARAENATKLAPANATVPSPSVTTPSSSVTIQAVPMDA